MPLGSIEYQREPAPTEFALSGGFAMPPFRSIRGADGANAGLRLMFSTSTADADPGAGKFRFNNASIAAATAAYIDNAEIGGADIAAFIDSFDDSLATIKGVMTIAGITNANKFALFNVTGTVVDGTGYRKVTIAHISSAGTWADDELFSISFARYGKDGAFSTADPLGIPTFGKKVPYLDGVTPKAALIEDLMPFSFVNILQDGGRFSTTPEPNNIVVGSYVAPNYFTPNNASTFAAGPKFINNNTTWGGAAGALDADVDSLVQLMRPGAGNWCYGTEFFLMDITQGGGTVGAVTISAAVHYPSFSNPTYPLPRSLMTHLWLKPVSGSLGLAPSSATQKRFVNGSELTAYTAYGPGPWLRWASYINAVDTFSGYNNALWQILATPGSVFRVAAPVLAFGHAYKGQLIQVTPSAGAIR